MKSKDLRIQIEERLIALAEDGQMKFTNIPKTENYRLTVNDVEVGTLFVECGYFILVSVRGMSDALDKQFAKRLWDAKHSKYLIRQERERIEQYQSVLDSLPEPESKDDLVL